MLVVIELEGQEFRLSKTNARLITYCFLWGYCRGTLRQVAGKYHAKSLHWAYPEARSRSYSRNQITHSTYTRRLGQPQGGFFVPAPYQTSAKAQSQLAIGAMTPTGFAMRCRKKGLYPVRVGNPAISPSNTARVDIIGIPAASRSGSVAPKTGGASPSAMTGAATSSDPSSFSLPPPVQAMGLSLMK